MKKSLLALALGALLLPQTAEAQVEYTYAVDPIDYIGTQKKETFDVAIFLPGGSFENFSITGVKVPVNDDKGIAGYSNAKVWLTSELALESKKNVADIATYDAEVSEDGYISLTLPESYLIPAEGVYVGYSFDVTTLDAGTKMPVAVGVGGADPNGFYMHSSRTYMNWNSYSEKYGACSALAVYLEGSLPAVGVTPASFPASIYAGLNEPTSFVCTLSTTSSEPIESLDVDYEINGITGTVHCEMESPIPAAMNKLFDVEVTLPAFSEKISGEMNFSINTVNGKTNEVNCIASSKFTVFSFIPVHNALLEEFTCTKCGYCTRGFAALEYIKNNYPDMVLLSYHNSAQGADPMVVSPNVPSGVSANGNPAASIDRAYFGDPYFGCMGNLFQDAKVPTLAEMQFINSQLTPWYVKASYEWNSEDELEIKAEAMNFEGVENGNFKFAYVLGSDGLTGTTSSWDQTNYYSSYAQSDAYPEEMNNFCSGGIYGKSSVKGLVYNDVVVDASATNGIKNSIPATLAPEEMVNHSHVFNVAKNTIIQNRDNLFAVVIVLDSKGDAVNCCKVKVTTQTGVDSIRDFNENAPVEFYNLNGVKVDNPSNGIFIRRQGTATSKVVIR